MFGDLKLGSHDAGIVLNDRSIEAVGMVGSIRQLLPVSGREAVRLPAFGSESRSVRFLCFAMPGHVSGNPAQAARRTSGRRQRWACPKKEKADGLLHQLVCFQGAIIHRSRQSSAAVSRIKKRGRSVLWSVLLKWAKMNVPQKVIKKPCFNQKTRFLWSC